MKNIVHTLIDFWNDTLIFYVLYFIMLYAADKLFGVRGMWWILFVSATIAVVSQLVVKDEKVEVKNVELR